MPRCPPAFPALRNDGVDSMLLEPARLGDGCGGRKDQRARGFDTRKQLAGRQAEMKAHDGRPHLFDDRAHRLAEWCACWRRCNAGRVDAGLGIIGGEPIAPARLGFGIGRRLGMAEEIHVVGSVGLSPDRSNLFA
jgi:hypothetical protein